MSRKTRTNRHISPALILLGAVIMMTGCSRKPEVEKTDDDGNRIVLLEAIGRQLEARAERRVSDGLKFASLNRGETRIDFHPTAALAYVNGTPFVIDGPTQWIEGHPYIRHSDVEHVIIPLLRPDQLPRRRTVKRILIDPGHGGKDPGAVNSEFNLREKDLALETSRHLARALHQMGFVVALTRNEDRFVELNKRPAIAADFNADLFLSIHFNAATNTAARGIEVFTLPPASADPTQPPLPGHSYSPWNSLLAFSVQDAMIQTTGQTNRGVKRARFAVLRTLPCPGILIEGGFISNTEDARMLQSDDYLQSLAEAIAQGVKTYHETLN